jgi:succinoglycan biosynthesis protein ExoA
VMRKHGQPAALRHLLPGGFVLLLGVFAIAALFGAPAWPALLLGGAYAVLLVAASLQIAGRTSWRLVARVPAVIAAYHFGYGIGSLLGWVDVAHGARAGRAWFARLTR